MKSDDGEEQSAKRLLACLVAQHVFCCHRAETSAHEREEEQCPFANASVTLFCGPLVPPKEEEGCDVENGIEAESRGDECHDGLYNPNPARLAFRIAKKVGLCP